MILIRINSKGTSAAGAAGVKCFFIYYSQNTFKTRLDTFGNDFVHFGILKKKFLKIFENSTLHGTPGIIFFQKNHPKTRLDSFLNIFGHFWNFENIFFENFRRLDLPWKTGQKFFESSPQNLFKTRLDTFGNDFGVLGNLKLF